MFWAGAIFRWWATLYIGHRKDRRELIRTGPYSLCRHPLYLGSALLTLSIGAFLTSATLSGGLLLACAVYGGIAIPREERRLITIYGESYLRYMAQVPRLVPRSMAFQSAPTVEVHLAGLRAEFFRMLRWMWIPFLSQWVVLLRSEAWWPHFLWLP